MIKKLVAALLIILAPSIGLSTTLLVHGDSLSAGYGISPEDTWVQLLKNQAPNISVVNASISGETTRGGLERLPSLLTTKQPDILVLELGANDGLRGYSLAQMKNNLQAMIDMGQSKGAEVILVGIRLPPNLGKRYTEPFYQTFKELADSNSLAYLPFLLEGVAQFDQLMQADGLHPNKEAQSIILNNIMPLIKASISKINDDQMAP